MHRAHAAIMAIGVSLFVVGVGIALVNHSEAMATDLTERFDSSNDRTMVGVFLAAIGAGLAVFALLIDEARRSMEREKRRGFFY